MRPPYFFSAFIVILFALAPLTSHAWDQALIDACKAVAAGTADKTQKALVVYRNKEINQMALRGAIEDPIYQAAQHHFNSVNNPAIQKAAKAGGLKAKLQASSNEKYNAGTDTDVLVESRRSGKKITLDNIEAAEKAYQDEIRQYLKAGGIEPPPGKINTDTDFMPTRSSVTDAEFTRINEHINAHGGTAYVRPGAAEVEFQMRLPKNDPGRMLNLRDTGEYVSEMRHLATHKFELAEKWEAEAGLLMAGDPTKAEALMADAQLARSQGGKYLQRIDKVTGTLAEQNGVFMPKNPNAASGRTLSGDSLDSAIRNIGDKGRGVQTAGDAAMVGELGELGIGKGVRHYTETLARMAAIKPSQLEEIQAIIAAQARSLPPEMRNALILRTVEAYQKAGGTAAGSKSFGQKLVKLIKNPAALTPPVAAPVSATGAARPGLGNMSKIDRAGLYLQAIFAAREAVQREDAAARKEKRRPSYVRAYMEAFAIMLGKTAYEAGLNASNQSLKEKFERIDKMIKAGEDPNLFLEDLRALSLALIRTAGEVSGVGGVVEDFEEMVNTALNVMNGPAHVNELVRQRADALAAGIEKELGEINALLPELEALYPETKALVEDLNKAITPMENALRRFEQMKKDVEQYDKLCTDNNLSMQEIDSLRREIQEAIEKAEKMALDIYRSGGDICRTSEAVSTPSGKGAVIIPPKGLSEDWNALRERLAKKEALSADIAAKNNRLRTLVKKYNANNEQIEVAALNASPTQLLETLPSLRDEILNNVDLAKEPTSKFKTLAETIESKAAGVRRRAEMLYDAKALEEMALGFMVEADRVKEKVAQYSPSQLDKTISDALNKYPAAVDRISESAANLQAILDQSCANPPGDIDTNDIDAKIKSAATVYAQADKAYNEARVCAEKVLGSMAVPLPPKPGAQAGSSTGAGKPKTKEEKPWVYAKFDRPVYMYRFRKETKDVSLMLARSLFDKDSGGFYLIPDGSGGVYHEDCEVSGPYGGEEALCAVIRGYGKKVVGYIGGYSSVECPPDGPTAQPALMDSGGATTAQGGGKQPTKGNLTVGSVTGSAQVLSSAGATQTLGGGGNISSGSTIQTGADGRVTLISPQGTTVVIGPKTRAQTELEAGGKRQGFNLLEGSIDVNHPGKGSDDVMIRSVDGTIVADGTKYRVEKDASGTRVQVFEGSVRLTGEYIIRTYAPGVEHGKPSPVKEMRLEAGQQALMALGSNKPSTLPSWMAGGEKPADQSPLSQPDPWNNPQVQRLVDQWISQAVPQSSTPGVVMHYNEWLQPLSQAARSTGPPDHPADWTRYRYAWENRMRYGSTNLCTLGEFIELSLSGKETSGCAKGGAAAGATPSWLTKPTTTAPLRRKPDDLVEQARQDLAQQQALPQKEPQRPAAPPKVVETPKPVAKPIPPPATTPTPSRRSDDIVKSKKNEPDFAGSWKCVITNSNGATAESIHSIYRDKTGTYQLFIPKSGGQFPAKYVDGNKIGFVIGDGTTDKDVILDFEVNGNIASGTDRIQYYDGRTYTHSIHCQKIGKSGERK